MKRLVKFLREERGSVLIETALVAPVLVMMTLGGVEISSIVARQTELQSIAGNAMEIILVSAPQDDADVARTTDEAKTYIAQAAGLTPTTGNKPASGQVSIYKRYRCGNNSARQATEGCANEAQTISTFLVIHLKDTYTPVWTNYGIGHAMTFEIKRSVQIG